MVTPGCSRTNCSAICRSTAPRAGSVQCQVATSSSTAHAAPARPPQTRTAHSPATTHRVRKLIPLPPSEPLVAPSRRLRPDGRAEDVDDLVPLRLPVHDSVPDPVRVVLLLQEDPGRVVHEGPAQLAVGCGRLPLVHLLPD